MINILNLVVKNPPGQPDGSENIQKKYLFEE
ncbi:hypothetical protein MNBD_ALPHA02-98 [hydrothermal vent metagenome]|uniref:Uncharacterized protein n=1 Tax=hydrothermal vent metagenome TaxID=652676 RepID=A0A3B0RNI5_9ZZZZ